jgi:hypothetical protein
VKIYVGALGKKKDRVKFPDFTNISIVLILLFGSIFVGLYLLPLEIFNIYKMGFYILFKEAAHVRQGSQYPIKPR